MEYPLRMALASIDLGNGTARILSGGRFRLDGGAMFGIIPKAVWSRQTAADADNHIGLACNCLLVEGPVVGGRRVIIETGHGPKHGEKDRRFFAIDPGSWLLPRLLEESVAPESVTDVVLTHLHFDHAGGLTHEVEGRVVPTFPNAAVHVDRTEFDDARANYGVMTNTYREENFLAIDDAGAWRFNDRGDALPEGIEVMPTPGHTRGHRTILIRGSDRTIAFAGDVLPTARHTGRAYNMAYDLFPLENRSSKGRLLEAAVAGAWTLVLGHEPETPMVRVIAEREWFRLEAGT